MLINPYRFAQTPLPILDGLVFCVDAANPLSYPGSGTTWSDLAGTNHATLLNGPTFDAANSGSIVFDGVNDYALTASTALSFPGSHAVCAFVSPNFASSSATGSAIFDFSNADGTRRTYLRWEGPSLGFYWDVVGAGNNVLSRTTSAPSFSSGSWLYVCCSYDSTVGGQFFINGASVSTSRNGSGVFTNLANLPIKIGFGSVNNYRWNGKIAAIHVYNRALSSAEILSNFNLYRSRYGL